MHNYYFYIFKKSIKYVYAKYACLLFCILQVAHCYPDDLKTYPQEIVDILQTHNIILDNEMRMVSITWKLNYAIKYDCALLLHHNYILYRHFVKH